MCTTTLRSVDDYSNDKVLAEALQTAKKTQENDGSDRRSQTGTSQDNIEVLRVSAKEQEGPPENADWVLTNYDKSTTKGPTEAEEFERLRVLRSYLILDAEPEEVFDCFTAQATRAFNVPIALVSLVDLGRQWFMSSCGLGASQTPRSVAFCAHAILQIDQFNVFQVADATKDIRFRNNPLVTGPPFVQFYAGAPLVSPEGYSLGTFCVIDRKPRPGGLTKKEQEHLKELAAETVKRMVARRRRMEKSGLKPRLGRRRQRAAQEGPRD